MRLTTATCLVHLPRARPVLDLRPPHHVLRPNHPHDIVIFPVPSPNHGVPNSMNSLTTKPRSTCLRRPLTKLAIHQRSRCSLPPSSPTRSSRPGRCDSPAQPSQPAGVLEEGHLLAPSYPPLLPQPTGQRPWKPNSKSPMKPARCPH